MVAWISVAVFLAAQGVLAFLCFQKSAESGGDMGSALFWVGILFVCTTIISLFVVALSAKNINLAGHTLETAAEFLADHKMTVLFPLCSWIVYIAWTALSV